MLMTAASAAAIACALGRKNFSGGPPRGFEAAGGKGHEWSPSSYMAHKLGEHQRQQVNTLLAELQANHNSNTTVFGEEEVMATAHTYTHIQEIYHSNARL